MQISIEELNENTRRLFDAESMGMGRKDEATASLRDQEVMEQFEKNIEQEESGHYKVMLPWNNKKPIMSKPRRY